MTSDGDAYEVLGVISRSFLPIRVLAPDDTMIADHEEEFLQVVHSAFEKQQKKSKERANPIVAIAPIFYGMRDWVKPERENDRKGLSYVTFIEDLEVRLRLQVAFTKARGERDKTRVRGFTSTVLDELNKRSDIKRLLVIIRLGEDLKEFQHGSDLCITANVPRATRDHFLGDLARGLKPERLRIHLSQKQPWQDNDGETAPAKVDYPSVADNETKILWHGLLEQRCANGRLEERSVNGAVPDEIHSLVVGHANEHSLYIDDQHSLVYIFSNVVQVRRKSTDYQRGCGGLFVLVNNEALRDDLDWLHQAKSLSDKLANRIIHQAQLDEVEHHALNSAITQTVARNYAHHIGAHVKMRTTPQEIKKRINDLYPALSLDL